MSQHPRRHIPLGADNFLSVLEGIEGGFAIFVGIIAGLYFQNISHDLLVIAGVIGLTVNAFNSSAVRYATEHYMDELDGREKRNKIKAYFVPAFIADTFTAITLTILLTLVILFTAGWYRGALLGHHALRDGLELAGLGIAIILVGTTAGWVIASIVA